MAVIEIPGGDGAAFLVKKDQMVVITNTFGTQVVDTWALNPEDTDEYFSVEHTRRMLSSLFLKEGDLLYSNRRTPMFRLEKDTADGRHDMLCACCDPWLYKHYGHEGHRSCYDNFRMAVQKAGYDAAVVPNPLNLWMNVNIADNQSMTLERPVSTPGDHVILRALADTVVVLSACPMDITPVNGGDGTPQPVHYEVIT